MLSDHAEDRNTQQRVKSRALRKNTGVAHKVARGIYIQSRTHTSTRPLPLLSLPSHLYLSGGMQPLSKQLVWPSKSEKEKAANPVSRIRPRIGSFQISQQRWIFFVNRFEFLSAPNPGDRSSLYEFSPPLKDLHAFSAIGTRNKYQLLSAAAIIRRYQREATPRYPDRAGPSRRPWQRVFHRRH